MKGVCVLEGMCCMHDSWGPREKGAWRKRNREGDSFKGEHCWFFCSSVLRSGRSGRGGGQGRIFPLQLTLLLPSLLPPWRPQNPSRGQPPAPSNEAPGPLTTGGPVWHAPARASPHPSLQHGTCYTHILNQLWFLTSSFRSLFSSAPSHLGQSWTKACGWLLEVFVMLIVMAFH